MLLGENRVQLVYVKQRRDETLIGPEGNSMLTKADVQWEEHAMNKVALVNKSIYSCARKFTGIRIFLVHDFM